MKLIFCKYCQDLVRLILDQVRECRCGKCWGKYTDDLNVEVSQTSLVMGVGNSKIHEFFTSGKVSRGESMDINMWFFKRDYERITYLKNKPKS